MLENKPTITRFGGNEKSIRPKCEGREHVYPTRPIRIGAENAAALRRNVSFFGKDRDDDNKTLQQSTSNTFDAIVWTWIELVKFIRMCLLSKSLARPGTHSMHPFITPICHI